MIKVLTINGGGSLGYIGADILVKLEQYIGKPLHEYFDYVAGVSTGSILGFSVAIGESPEVTKNKYREFIPKIFTKKRGFISSLFKPYYEIKNLKNALHDNFNELRVKDVIVPYMTHSTKIDGQFVRAKFWKSWEDETKASDAITASCAAPLYFSPYEFEEGIFVDGGLSSNTSNVCILSDLKKKGINLSEVKLLNISFNQLHGYSKPSQLDGLIKVAQHFPLLALFGTESIEGYQTETLLGERYLSLFMNPNMEIDSQDFSKMDTISNNRWSSYKPYLERWRDL